MLGKHFVTASHLTFGYHSSLLVFVKDLFSCFSYLQSKYWSTRFSWSFSFLFVFLIPLTICVTNRLSFSTESQCVVFPLKHLSSRRSSRVPSCFCLCLVIWARDLNSIVLWLPPLHTHILVFIQSWLEDIPIFDTALSQSWSTPRFQLPPSLFFINIQGIF